MKQEHSTLETQRTDRRIHVALPVRVTYWDEENKPCLDMACTYDISAHGARVTGLRYVKQAGDIIAVERGRNKSYCRVAWIGEPNSELHGQIGIQTVESDRVMWDAELRELECTYEAVQGNAAYGNRVFGSMANRNRRRSPRFNIEGSAKLLRSHAHPEAAALRDLSESGCCLVRTKNVLVPGTELSLSLAVGNYDLAVKGSVRHAEFDFGIGVEFREIRKGDRQVLQFLLRRLAEQEEESINQAAQLAGI
ncbi:MAG TPA: PilZ domain-containing protein [Terriglobales bacterium]|nr:PilZ domain-containing protein [Terriglobales bacterium]